MRLKELRLEEKKTQIQVASDLNLPYMTYHNYEIGRNEPNIETLKKIADYYHITIDYLVNRNFAHEIGYLTEQQKAVVKLICQLNENNLLRVASYISGMLAIQD